MLNQQQKGCDHRRGDPLTFLTQDSIIKPMPMAPWAACIKLQSSAGVACTRDRKGRRVMTTRFLIAVLAALIAPAIAAGPTYAAIAGQPNSADVKTIEACVADAAATKTDSDACIGRVSGSCLEKAPTTSAKEECSNRELLVWDAALNRDYARLTGLLTDDSVKQALRDAERDFFVAKLKQCTFERIVRKDAPTALAAAAQCNVKATARRDLWVLEQINSLNSQ
jgi:uncharacterized protein YecT (DUF1311 family)